MGRFLSVPVLGSSVKKKKKNTTMRLSTGITDGSSWHYLTKKQCCKWFIVIIKM